MQSCSLCLHSRRLLCQYRGGCAPMRFEAEGYFSCLYCSVCSARWSLSNSCLSAPFSRAQISDFTFRNKPKKMQPATDKI
uniref:Uncharacterized protein n=1 Tax=Fundulus heteroclitus TaxID=8078 RepID=A0A3Q2SS40_FUNHE